MPEIPEVETIRRQIEERFAGRKLLSIRVSDERLVKGTEMSDVEDLSGKALRRVGRHGKLLLLEFEGEATLIIHFGMTGRFLLFEEEAPNFTRAVFEFEGGKLAFVDPRRLGWISLSKEAMKKVGSDALSDELDLERFSEILKGKSRASVKAVLVDQSLVAGIGNAYADEILFSAGIRPDRKVSTLSEGEVRKLFVAMKGVLERAVRLGGHNFDRFYSDIYGNEGNFGKEVMVHGRGGEPCKVCGTPIKKIKISGRSAYFCPKCQK